MSEHNSILCGELQDNLFLILSQLSSILSTVLAINCDHASNWFTHRQRTRQIDGQKNDNSVLTVNVDLIFVDFLATEQKEKTA